MDTALQSNGSELEQSDFSIQDVADFLTLRGAKALTIIMSPTGDDGSTATVMLARALSERGRLVVLVDMTGSAAPTRLMSTEDGLSGIMDLLIGDAAFGDSIHHDRLSNAHIMPQGKGFPQQASRVLERLIMILSALTGTYETVLVEFGAAQINAVTRVLQHVDAEIVLSMPHLEDQLRRQTLAELEAEGFSDAILMNATSPQNQPAA